MDAKEKLANWLASKEKKYSIGVEIFVMLKIDPQKNKFFTVEKPQSIHESMLLKLLLNYARINRIKSAVINKPDNKEVAGGKKNQPTANQPTNGSQQSRIIQRPKVDKNPVVDYNALPEDLKIKFDQNGRLNNENKTYHAELKLIADDQEKKPRRKELAGLLVANRKKQRENWDLIDTWWKNQQNKSPEQLAVDQALEKQNRIKANMNYIRRNHNATKPKAIEELKIRMKELDAWGIDYEGLVEKLKAGTE